MTLSSNELKDTTKHFIYCPRCKNELNSKSTNLLTCSNCELHLYVNPSPTTGAVLVNEKDEVLLVKRKVDPGKGLWDIPGGFVDLNESLEESLRRELKEELGIEVSDFRYLTSKVDIYKYKDVYQQTLGVIFEAKISSSDKLKASDDISGFKFFKKEDIPVGKISFMSVQDFFNDYLNLTK